MNDRETDLKLRLIEVLLIILGIATSILVIKQNYLSMATFILFFPMAILYYVVVSNKWYQMSKKLLAITAFFVAVFFSSSLGITIGVTIPGNFTFQSFLAISYYVIFSAILFIALTEEKMIIQSLKKIRKLF